MSRRIKHDKVIRDYDGIDREESTAGLMFLRIFLALVTACFIVGVSALFLYSVKKETSAAYEELPQAAEENVFYQRFDTDVDEELLGYCNRREILSEYSSVALEQTENGIEVNTLMKKSLDKMLEAAAKDGIKIDVVRGYLSYEECCRLNKQCCWNLMDEGATQAEAEVRASQIFPAGGKNEYQTGMLVKFSDEESSEFERSEAYSWLYKNGINYGFINRYTKDKFDLTGIEEDLTVYRFVGTENAQKMRSFGMCLEEYYNYRTYRQS